MKLRKYIWEIVKRFTVDNYIGIKPTMRCNLKCPYCAVNLNIGKPPEYDEVFACDWIELIDKANPDMVVVSGGDPGIYSGIEHIINHCINRKMLVQITTNLTNINSYMRIKKSWRVIFLSTYHSSSSLDKYISNYKQLKKRFYITVRELRPKKDMKPKYIKWAKVKAIINDPETNNKPRIWYAPDLSIHPNCNSINTGGKK
jgi:MoaA/NifB/PqqE/SkfB family radical SAM enzyme